MSYSRCVPAMLVLIAATVYPLAAQEQAEQVPTAIDLETIRAVALQNNPSMREASAKLQASRGRWEQVGLLPNPNAGYSGQQLGSRGLAEQQGVVIGQQIITGGKLRLNRNIAEQDIRQAEHHWAAQRHRVITDVTTAYFEVLAAQEKLDIGNQFVAISEETRATTDRLFKAQQSSRIEVLQANEQAHLAKIALENAKNSYHAAWRRLGAVTGCTQYAPQPVNPEWEAAARELLWEDCLNSLFASSPELCAALAEAERARWTYQRALKQVYPDLDVQGIVQHDQQIRSTDGAVVLTMPVPIFDRNQGAIREAYYNISVAERKVERLRLDLQYRLSQAFERYENAKQQSERYGRDILPASAEQLKLIRSAYENGEVNYFAVLVAQRMILESRLAYVEGLRQRAAAQGEIEGYLLSGSLTTVGSN